MHLWRRKKNISRDDKLELYRKKDLFLFQLINQMIYLFIYCQVIVIYILKFHIGFSK